MERELENLLYTVIMPKRYRGYPYLVRAVMLVMENPSRLGHVCDKLYAPIAEENQTTVSAVHKDIRTLRDAFWNHDGGKKLVEWTGCRGWEYEKPYPKEFIEILAHILETNKKGF